MSQLFIKRGDRTLGPFTLDQLKVSAQKGQIKSSDQFAQTIEGPWTQADQVKGLNLDSQNSFGAVVTDPLGIGEPVAELGSIQGQGNQEQSMPELGGLAMSGSSNSNIGDILDETLVKVESQSFSKSGHAKLVEKLELTTMRISREWSKIDMLRAYKVVLDEKVINDRLQQVLVFKYRHFADSPTPTNSLLNKASDIAKLAAEKAIKVLRNEQGLWPLNTRPFTLAFAANPQGYEKITNDRGIGPNDPLSAQHVIVSTLQQRNTPHTLLSYQQLLAALNSDDFELNTPLVLVTEDYPLPGESFDVSEQQKILKKAIDKWPDQLIVIAMRSDYELENHPQLKTYICAYSSRAISAEVIAKLL